MNERIRAARPVDAESIARLHTRSWQVAYRGQLPDDYLDRLDEQTEARIEFWLRHIAEPPAKTEVWVADENGQIEGFVDLGPARDANANTGEIYAIYVHPTSWNRGVGRALFRHAADRIISLGFSAAILWVLESNTRARRFYELAGWSIDSRTKLETRAGGVELKEVSYRRELLHENQESMNEE